MEDANGVDLFISVDNKDNKMSFMREHILFLITDSRIPPHEIYGERIEVLIVFLRSKNILRTITHLHCHLLTYVTLTHFLSLNT